MWTCSMAEREANSSCLCGGEPSDGTCTVMSCDLSTVTETDLVLNRDIHSKA